MAPITVRPEQLNAIAEAIRTHSNRVQAAAQAIEAEMRRLGVDTFSGQSAEALRARYNAIQQRLLTFIPMLNKFAAQLDEAAAAFRKADAVEGSKRASGSWSMGAIVPSNSATSVGLGSNAHITAIQDATRSITWSMW